MMRAETPRMQPAAPSAPVLLGSSPAAGRLDEEIRAAAGPGCVLVEGEPGLELVDVARALHEVGRRPGPFVVIECGGAEPAQVDREIFGDASPRATGDVESIGARSALARAQHGTLFLNDLAELSAAAQARLARVARDGEVRIGGARPCGLDLAIVGGLSAELESEAAEGRLRRDLVRHLSRRRVVVPGLRRRAEDIPLIAAALVAGLCTQAGAPPRRLAPAAATLLSAMPWPGNLVELRGALGRILGDVAGESIGLEDVLAHVRFDGALAPHTPAGTLRSARRQFEREYITLVLRHHRGRVGDAARALGIQRTNLYRKARQLGISVARPVQQT